MKNFFAIINKKVNGVIWTLVSTGIFLLILGVLIVWTDFLLRLIIGLFVVIVAYVFFYLAYKIRSFKNDIEKSLRLK
ncbi:MAG: hypothetical protein ABIE43_03050 [Patescibacteria group bacterium]